MRRRFLRRMPKAEIHVHLEGTIRPATLLRLARRRRLDLPAADEKGLRRWFRFRDFEHFVQVYVTCSRCLRDPEDFQLVLAELAAELREQNVLYCEAHFTISTHLANGVNGGEVADALAETMAAAERDGVEIRLIPDIVRNLPVERADQTLEWALAGRGRGVVALGLSGVETASLAPFREHFREAESSGLGRVAHAGEQAGAESIRATLEACRPQRIGHGVRCLEDAALVERLAARRLPLEVCPSSNVALGVVPEAALHPFDELLRRGLFVTLNSDDPALFDTSLTEEYLRVAALYDYGPEELAALALAAVAASFLPPERKRALTRRMRSEMEALGEELLGRPVRPDPVEPPETLARVPGAG